MNNPLRRVLGVVGIGLSWGTVWAAFFATLGLIIGVFRPEEVDSGEGPVKASGIGFMVGLVSGAIFGMILSFAENRKSLLDLALNRVAFWGMLASAVWPLVTRVDDRMIYILCPLGIICASASVAIARRAALHDLERPELLRWIGCLLANPLQAACASNGRLA